MKTFQRQNLWWVSWSRSRRRHSIDHCHFGLYRANPTGCRRTTAWSRRNSTRCSHRL